jgi:hypothetical protein
MQIPSRERVSAACSWLILVVAVGFVVYGMAPVISSDTELETVSWSISDSVGNVSTAVLTGTAGVVSSANPAPVATAAVSDVPSGEDLGPIPTVAVPNPTPTMPSTAGSGRVSTAPVVQGNAVPVPTLHSELLPPALREGF